MDMQAIPCLFINVSLVLFINEKVSVLHSSNVIKKPKKIILTCVSEQVKGTTSVYLTSTSLASIKNMNAANHRQRREISSSLSTRLFPSEYFPTFFSDHLKLRI